MPRSPKQEVDLAPNRPYRIRSLTKDRKANWNVPWHFHDWSEIVYYHNIEGKIQLEGCNWSITTGDLIVLPHNILHSFEIQAGLSQYSFIHLRPAFIKKIQPSEHREFSPWKLSLNPQQIDQLERLIHWNTLEESQEESSVSESIVRLWVSWLMEKWLPNEAFENQPPCSRYEPLFRAIQEQKQFNLPLEKAASLCHISKSHFVAEFKKNFRISFHQYIQQQRLEMAKSKLIQSDLSISNIAADFGFSDASHFSHCFKKNFGPTPLQFRKNKRTGS